MMMEGREMRVSSETSPLPYRFNNSASFAEPKKRMMAMWAKLALLVASTGLLVATIHSKIRLGSRAHHTSRSLDHFIYSWASKDQLADLFTQLVVPSLEDDDVRSTSFGGLDDQQYLEESRSLLTTGGMSSPHSSGNTIWTGWSFCNQAQQPDGYASMGQPSPRLAQCPQVTERDNQLRFPDPIPGFSPAHDENHYARLKELYLSHKCNDSVWSIMFKSGNLDSKTSEFCPKTGGNSNASSNIISKPQISGPFDDLPMNQPLMVHGTTTLSNDDNAKSRQLYYYFAGTYDVNSSWLPWQIRQVQHALHQYSQAWLDHDNNEKNQSKPKPTPPKLLHNKSFLLTGWSQREEEDTGWKYSSFVQTSSHYPWLMNYLRANDGVHSQHPVGYGGYPWRGAGNLQGPVSANGNGKLIMKIRFRLLEDPPGHSQFYMPEFGGCWKKSDGSPCDEGDDNQEENLTRYLCYGVTHGSSICKVSSPRGCPPWHWSRQGGEWISALNTTHFPYHCYHGYCGPGWSKDGHNGCDPYSNPIPQELVQLQPCQEWGSYGFPTEPLNKNSPTDWELDIGALGNHVYFYDATYNKGYQQAPTRIPNRPWINFDVGPEIGIGSNGEGYHDIMTQWHISGWDIVQVPPKTKLAAETTSTNPSDWSMS
jgi:hypothetical protein